MLLLDGLHASIYCRGQCSNHYIHSWELCVMQSFKEVIAEGANVGYQHYFQHVSGSLQLIRFVSVGFRSEDEVSEEGHPVTYFCPALDPPLGGSGRKTTTMFRLNIFYFILRNGIWQKLYNIMIALSLGGIFHPYQLSLKSIERFLRRSWKFK